MVRIPTQQIEKNDDEQNPITLPPQLDHQLLSPHIRQKIGPKDAFGDRSGDGTPLSAFFNDDGYGDGRIFSRSETP